MVRAHRVQGGLRKTAHAVAQHGSTKGRCCSPRDVASASQGGLRGGALDSREGEIIKPSVPAAGSGAPGLPPQHPRRPPAARPSPVKTTLPGVGVRVHFPPPASSHPPRQCRQDKRRPCFPMNRPLLPSRKGQEGENAASLINCDMNSGVTQQLGSLQGLLLCWERRGIEDTPLCRPRRPSGQPSFALIS